MPLSRPVDRFRDLRSSLNGDGLYGRMLAGSCLALIALAAGGEPVRRALRYERSAIAAGQWWRLITGHCVHLGLEHAVLNCLGLALLWALFARDYSPRGWLVILGASVAAIDFGLWLGASTILWYVGSSGVLHGLMAAGTLASLRRGEASGWLLAAFLIAKLIYEQLHGALPFDRGMPVVVDAHLYGALGGAAGALLWGLAGRRVQDRDPKPV